MPLQKPTELSESQLRDMVLQYRRQNWQGIQTPQWQERIATFFVTMENLSCGRLLNSGLRSRMRACWTSVLE